MPLARVHDEHLARARGGEHLLGGCDRFPQQGHVVAERLAEAARVHEIALHVDDEQRAGARIELELVRLRLDRRHASSPKPGNVLRGLLYPVATWRSGAQNPKQEEESR